MILGSNDIVDWIADREQLLVAAWKPEFAVQLSWEPAFAEATASELYAHMLTTLLQEGAEAQFLKFVSRSGLGLDPKAEKVLATRFYSVNLKLARAARRRARYDATRQALPYLRTMVVNDGNHNPGHLAFADILLLASHPFWNKWYPPLDMDCRCGVVQMTESQFRRSGRQVTSEDDLAWKEERLSAAWPPSFLPLLDFRI